MKLHCCWTRAGVQLLALLTARAARRQNPCVAISASPASAALLTRLRNIADSVQPMIVGKQRFVRGEPRMRKLLISATAIAALAWIGGAALRAEGLFGLSGGDCGCQQDACFDCDACGGHGCDRGRHGHGHGHYKYYEGRTAHFNCGCNGSYKFPVPPLSTYHWPGMWSHQLMTDYHSPWRFPPLKPYVDEPLPVEMGGEYLPQDIQQAILQTSAETPIESGSMSFSSRVQQMRR